MRQQLGTYHHATSIELSRGLAWIERALLDQLSRLLPTDAAVVDGAIIWNTQTLGVHVVLVFDLEDVIPPGLFFCDVTKLAPLLAGGE